MKILEAIKYFIENYKCSLEGKILSIDTHLDKDKMNDKEKKYFIELKAEGYNFQYTLFQPFL